MSALSKRGLGTISLVLVGLAQCREPERAEVKPASPPVAAAPAAADGPEAREAKRRAAALETLTQWEESERGATDFAAATPWSRVAGPDPYKLRRLADGTTLGLLRGRGQLVHKPAEADAERFDVMRGATGWATTADGSALYVVGTESGRVQTVMLPGDGADALSAGASFDVAGVYSLRDVDVGARGQLALADAYRHRIVVGSPPQPGASLSPTFEAPCAGPLVVRWLPTHLIALCSLDHQVQLWRLDDAGQPTSPPATVEHDGPIWSLDAVPLPDGTVRLALGGVEDHPLDRSDGAFGYIDSFVFVTDVPGSGTPVRRATLNVSAHDVITPKWIALNPGDAPGDAPADAPAHPSGATVVQTIGYGSPTLLRVTWDAGFGEPAVSTTSLMPGVTDVLTSKRGLLAASPLLDAWVTTDTEGAVAVRPVATRSPDPRTSEVRLGEALLFTGLMAPAGRTEGKASRFTCETCHFEGGVDGRVHFTGRDDVHASTRSIRGLFANRPHFSRALDGTMTEMVDNEFRVAGKGTGADPWFSLSPNDVPWLTHLGVDAEVDAVGLRRALMAFMMVFNHEPNPAAVAKRPAPAGLASLADVAELFERQCEGCHAARLVTDQPQSRLPREAWAERIRSPDGAIVWAQDERMRTGIEPYVHERGARVPALARLYAKRPYFTDGGATSLGDALDRFSVGTDQHVRDAADGRALSPVERRSLLYFLELL
ncbi:MAG: hypothetical protein AAF721_04870 [Myxococcota bacterium]